MEVMEESTESEKTTNLWLKILVGVLCGLAFLAVYTAVLLRVVGVV